jgi:hypothetical protein
VCQPAETPRLLDSALSMAACGKILPLEAA